MITVDQLRTFYETYFFKLSQYEEIFISQIIDEYSGFSGNIEKDLTPSQYRRLMNIFKTTYAF